MPGSGTRWAAAVLASTLVTAPPAFGLIVADHPDDVCSPADDPCIVDEVVRVEAGVLDFGTREVRLTGNGQLDVGNRFGTIRCGDFVADVPGVALRILDPGNPVGEGGVVDIEARRRCSIGTRPCLQNTECQLGSCNRRRCSLRATRSCQQDQDCQLGTCIAPGQPNARRCTTSLATRCSTNADCQLGVCPSQLTCANGPEAIACSADVDCDFGACTIGTGRIELDGGVMGRGDPPGWLLLEGAGDVTVHRNVNISSDVGEDGGVLRILSRDGDVTLLGSVDASGGELGQGGEIELTASGNVTVDGLINCNGGSYDGGRLKMTSGMDVLLLEDVLCSGLSYEDGSGYGGEITATAGRDVRLGGGTAADPTVVTLNGVELYYGEAGFFIAAAGRDVVFEKDTAIRALGGLGGFGGELDLEAGRDIVLDGDVVMTATGQEGGGGILQADAGGRFSVGAEATIDVSAFSGGGMRADSEGAMTVAGTIDVGGGIHGESGGVFLESQSDFELTGSMITRGKDGVGFPRLVLDIQACNVHFGPGAEIDNAADDERNRIASREQIIVEAGAVVRTDGGETRLIYRTPQKPPVLDGVFDPEPTLELDPALDPCPVCGNNETEETETCDDGNTSGGDGCSADCQDEACIADTPGYPEQPLCDDEDPCTTDACIADDGCNHAPCDDGVECTDDTCTAEGCSYAANHAACKDGDPCTDDTCTVSGCQHADNEAPCDDGDECTAEDTCNAGTCTGIAVPGCGIVCGDDTVEGNEECDDGDTAFAFGDACRADCSLVPCGRPTDGGGAMPKVTDALFVLRVAVGQLQCALSVCDVDADAAVDAGDALRVMRAAVGQAVELTCPDPPAAATAAATPR